MENGGFTLGKERKKIRREQRRYSFMLPFGFELQYPLSWRWAVLVSPLLSERCVLHPLRIAALILVFHILRLPVRPSAASRALATVDYSLWFSRLWRLLKKVSSFYNFRPSSACQLLPQNPFPSLRIFLLSFMRNAAWRAKVSFYLWITRRPSERDILHIFSFHAVVIWF